MSWGIPDLPLLFSNLFPGDGRRLTLLIYLNPGWKKEDGGALRLFPNDYQNSKAGTEGTILRVSWCLVFS